MNAELINIKKLRANPNNPRVIRDEKFKKLVKSVKDFPEMLRLRPIVYDSDGIILGGNMRFEAQKAAGYTEVWAVCAEGLTEEQKREFIIKDNVGFGDWDHDVLANEWGADLLADWGLDIPVFESLTDYSEKNKEVDTDGFADQMTIKLNYSEAEYNIVREQLGKVAATPEMAVWKLLGNE